jgi:hypothetical protein
MYLYAREDSGQLPTTLGPRTPPPPVSPTAASRAPSETEQTAGWFGEPAIRQTVPAFRFICPAGCAPRAANECIGIVRRSIQDAIWLAENAAAKLKARDNEALRLFRRFFGDPSRPVPWADNRPAADLVADRFRAVAHGFRTRVPHVRCSTAADPCGAAAAFVVPRQAPTALIPLPRNTITLCPPFWSTANAFRRAAMLLHEMLHLLFWEFFGHQENLPRPGDPEERRRDNSYCYHVFALRVAGHGASQFWRSRCTDRPA